MIKTDGSIVFISTFLAKSHLHISIGSPKHYNPNGYYMQVVNNIIPSPDRQQNILNPTHSQLKQPYSLHHFPNLSPPLHTYFQSWPLRNKFLYNYTKLITKNSTISMSTLILSFLCHMK